ncbi:sensor histidine kinase [Sandaracinus amylolyticus]|uniref:sensor histidine kinase n=1 Tax=Sandaracinus amylolyticus TaxID=927083 RepID=UPI001F2509C6|nr:HAMP domain-containing sensor histidine kinase [Sandaracinus amylolyticus]UJR79113.1 Two-component hybrid sensor and regulator [Sandaracinus amylolyticus]
MAVEGALTSSLRERVLARWSAREGGAQDRDAQRLALLERCVGSADGTCDLEPAPCHDVASAHELAGTTAALVHLGAVLRDLTLCDSAAGVRLQALSSTVDRAIDAHVAALEQGVERAFAIPELAVREEAGAPDEVDYVWDVATDAISWVDRRRSRSVPIAKQLGTTRASFHSHIHTDDRDRVARTLRESMARADELFWSEYRLQRPDGTWADVLERAVLVRSGGRVVHALGHLRERTMVRRLLRELEEAHERLEAANSAAQIGTIRIDRERLVTVRDAMLNRILGLPAEPSVHAYGETLTWVHPGDRDRLGAEIDRAMIDGSVVPLDCRVLRKDGTTRWVRGRARGLRTEDGTLRWLTGAVLDVTDEHEHAVERQRLLEDARRSRAEAEAMSRAKEEFLALVSHELRGPVNAMLGWLSLIRSGQLDAAQLDRALATLDRNAHAQSRLIEDLLDMSRVLAGKLRLELDVIDVASLASEAIASWEPAALAKSITLSNDGCASERALVLGDAGRLQQVLSNLLGNAIKFTPRGGCVSMKVSCTSERVRIAVRDTGPGIPESERERIFESFRQSGSQGARRESGLGLGLALVKTLVELHGGTVRVETPDDGRGSVLVVELPRRDQP